MGTGFKTFYILDSEFFPCAVHLAPYAVHLAPYTVRLRPCVYINPK